MAGSLTGDLGDAGRMRAAVSGPVGKVVVRVATAFATERARWVLWIPVFLGCGIAVYFALPAEPVGWSGPAVLGAALFSVLLCRARPSLLLAVWALVLGALGYSAAQLRTALVAAPVLDRSLGAVHVEGQVVRVEVLTDGRRLWLVGASVQRLAPSRTPERLRIRIRGAKPAIRPGDRISVRAALHPPSAPAAPGAFDFARRAYFERLGAVGYAMGPVTVLESGGSPAGIALEALRQTITRTILDALPGTAGAVAAALMTGERGAIPEDALAAMRDSGLAHLLAISGLHIGLVGGLLFFAVRLSFAVWEGAALRLPIKKYAAVAALVGSLGYLLISGATLPTQRAFLMLCLVMLAVLLDRSPISMNLVAWAAGVILLVAPESLTSVSFQMSFAAVVALVAVYETGVAGRAGRIGHSGLLRQAWSYLAAVLLTTVVAGAATAPFALYHFNRFALYGVLANLLAVPLTAMWVMPCAVLSFLLMPFGLEAVGLTPMGWGIEGVVGVAQWVQALPGSIAVIPAMPAWSLALAVFGGLWLCLWRTRWRVLGIVPVIVGALGAAFVETPDILVSETGKLVAIKGEDGALVFSAPPKGFVAETWLRRSGQATPASGEGTGGRQRCDALGCIYRVKGKVIADIHAMAALPDDCASAYVVLSRIAVRDRQCRGPALVIDRFDLWRNGAHALWLDHDRIRLETVGNSGGGRPWSRYPRQNRRNSNTGG